MTFGEEIKKKADEVSLDTKAREFGDALAEMAKTAIGLVTNAAKENQDKIEGAIDKAAGTIDEKTGGKHSETIAKVKDQAQTGLGKIVEQGDKVAGGAAGSATGAGAGAAGVGAAGVGAAGADVTGAAAGKATDCWPRVEPTPGQQTSGAAATDAGDDVPADTHSAFDEAAATTPGAGAPTPSANGWPSDADPQGNPS